MYMVVGLYHKFLRGSALLVTTVLLFDGGFVVPITEQLSDNTVEYLANVTGVFASVPQNELNAVSGQLSAWERELAEREARLAEREITARDFGTSKTNYSTYVLSIILFILTALIVLNYALDWQRQHTIFNERQTA